MHTVLGAGGVVGSALVAELRKKGGSIRLVGRKVPSVEGAQEAVSADLSRAEETIDAVSGSTVVYLVVGLKYDRSVWDDLWPKVMRNTIEACKRTGAKLVFLDNVYMYGKVNGPMTEETPFTPSSKKGEIRARIAEMLLDEVRAGNLTALIARSADFYGPGAKTGVANVLVFDKLAKGGSASVLVNDTTRHSYTFTPDIGKSMVLLAETESSWNQSWHLPTAPDPPTGKEFVEMVASEFGVRSKFGILTRWMTTLVGTFNPTVREVSEMLYQNEMEYIFDSTKFSKAFEFKPTSYRQGIKLTVDAYR